MPRMARETLLLLVCIHASAAVAMPSPPLDTNQLLSTTRSETIRNDGSDILSTGTLDRAPTAASWTLTTVAAENSTTAPDQATTASIPLAHLCLEALRDWTPWSPKSHNLDSNECGLRQRTRMFRSGTSEQLTSTCVSEMYAMTQYKEQCEILGFKDNVRAIQFYLVDAVFGNTRPARNRSFERFDGRRRKRTVTFNFLEFDIATCPRDMTQRPVDFLILLDNSGRMLPRDFHALLRSVAFLIQNGIPSLSRASTRVAMMTFAGSPKLEFDFKTCNDKRCAIEQLRKAEFDGGVTRVREALTGARETFEMEHGMRECSRRVALLITYGPAPGEINIQEAANRLKFGGHVELFVVGISDLINEPQLRTISSLPALTHHFYLPNSQQARRVFKKISRAIAIV